MRSTCTYNELSGLRCRRHDAQWFKIAANPYLGHVYERAWSLLLDCHQSEAPYQWIDACRQCEESSYSNCTATACQCLDEVEVTETESTSNSASLSSLSMHNVTGNLTS